MGNECDAKLTKLEQRIQLLEARLFITSGTAFFALKALAAKAGVQSKIFDDRYFRLNAYIQRLYLENVETTNPGLAAQLSEELFSATGYDTSENMPSIFDDPSDE